MKKLKCLIAVLLIFSLMPASFGFAEEAVEETDITQLEEFKKLAAFNIISSDDEIVYYDTVTRSIFLSYAMKCCLGYDAYAENTDFENPFSDVSENTTGFYEIVAARHLGMISGENGTQFRPDDDITMYEAAKIIIYILGYDEMAKHYGGYPTGYMLIANKLNIFKGCTFTEDGFITAESFIKAMMNCLETEVLDIDAVIKKTDRVSATYTTIEDRTLLECVFGIRKAEGIVESNEYTSIYGLTQMDNNRAQIGGKVYNVSDTDAAELLGYNTLCYYKQEKGADIRELVYITEYRNDAVTIDSSNIVKDSVTNTNFRFYSDDEKKKTDNIELSKAAVLIYNGGQKKLTSSLLCPSDGTVTLIDNDRDNVCDVVRVMNYRTILVSGISQSSYRISDLLGGTPIALDPEDDDYEFVIEIDGKSAGFSEIVDRNVISYAESSGNKKNIKYVKVSTKTAEGFVDSIGEDFVTVNGKEYLLGSRMANSIELRNYGIFYIDSSGKIVAKKLENEVGYGYLNAIEKETMGTVRVQIFTENNRWVILELEKNINYNDSKKAAKDVYDKFVPIENCRQLITYTVNSEGKINMIKTAESFTEYSVAEENAIEQDIFRVYPKIAKANYRGDLKCLQNSSTKLNGLLVGDNTKIFMIPDQSAGRADTDKFYIRSANSFLTDELCKNITPYDLDRTRTAGAIVMEGNEKSVDKKSSFMIVQSMIRSNNSYEVDVDSVKGYYKNALIILPAADENVFNVFEEEPLSKGDIIQFALDEKGNISDVELHYNFSDGLNQKSTVGSLYASSTFLSANVYFADLSKNKLVADSNEGMVVLGINSSTVINIYDIEDETLTEGTLADLEKGSSFYARVNYFIAKEIVVYQ